MTVNRAAGTAAQIEAQAADWLARRDAGGWGAPQQAALDAWLAQATAHRVAYLRLASVWQRADRLTLLRNPRQPSVAVPGWAQAWARFSTRRMAASLLLAAALGGVLAASGLLRPGTGYSTALGETKSVALADGSRVALNTDTRLRARMAERQRTVWLEQGEAYFEVAHDAQRPFVVEAGASRVTVLGTRFSVRRDGDRLKVVVAEGRVQVAALGSGAAAGAPRPAAVITRNDALVLAAGQLAVTHGSAEQVASQLGWRQGRLVLDDMTLAQAAAEFNRYNSVKLVVTDPTAAELRIGGSFNVDNVQGFARLLQQGFGLKVDIEKEEIRVHR